MAVRFVRGSACNFGEDKGSAPAAATNAGARRLDGEFVCLWGDRRLRLEFKEISAAPA